MAFEKLMKTACGSFQTGLLAPLGGPLRTGGPTLEKRGQWICMRMSQVMSGAMARLGR